MIKVLKRLIASAIALTVSMQCCVALAAGSTYSFSGWTVEFYNNTGEAYIDNETYHSGGGALKLINYTPKTSNRYINMRTTVDLVEGRQYNVGAWIKAKDVTQGSFHINWDKHRYVTSYGNSYDWRNYEFIYTAQKSGSHTFYFIQEGTATAIWLDDIRFIDSVTGENLIKNSTFDSGSATNGSIATPGQTGTQKNLEELYNSIRTGESFSEEDMQKVRGAFKYMTVYPAEGIEIDGKGEDWENYPELSMPTIPSEQYTTLINDGKAYDNTAVAKFAYDEDNFYLYIEVTDDIFQYLPGNDKYWQGDSLQLTISSLDEDYGSEIGFAFNPSTGEGEKYGLAFSDDAMEKILLKASNVDKKTVYEAAVPWNLKFDKVPEAILFDFLVNDNDGEGRRNVLELTPGICEGKVNDQFQKLEILNDEKDWYAWVEGERNGFAGEEQTFNCYLVNSGDAGKFTITDKETGEVKEFTVLAKRGIRYEIKRKYDEEGKYSVSVEFAKNSDSFDASTDISIVYAPATEEYARGVIEVMREQISEIATLLKQCEENNIDTAYETADYTVLKIYPESLEKDLEKNDLSRVYYTERTTKEIYNKTKASLEAYLAGEDTPKRVAKYVTSEMEILGEGVSASMEYLGIVEKKPMFFVGYGHHERVINDVYLFRDLGMNLLQAEIGPTNVLVNSGNGTDGKEYVFDDNSVGAKKARKVMEYGDKYNVGVSMIMSPHYFPTEAATKYGIGGNKGFLKFNINAPEARNIVETYLRGLVPMIKDYKSLNNICISNEPQFHADMFPDFYAEDWHEFLRERYGNIETLNMAYGENFTDFAEVGMEADSSQPAKVYDNKVFNDLVTADWHMWMADIIHEIAPDVPLNSKIMEYTYPSSQYVLDYGVGYEHYYEKFAINGNDASRYYLNDTREDFVKSMWYDYMTSIRPAPVFNSEDHVIPDYDQTFTKGITEEVRDFLGQDLYQGAIHGRSMSAIWNWDRVYSKNDARYGSILERPDALSEASRIALDLNRLAYELTALQNEPRDVGIIYPDMDMVVDLSAMSASYEVYNACVLNGKRPLFVVDWQPEKMHDCSLIIIPKTKYMPEKMLTEIKKYIENGGKVLIFGKGLMYKNEKNLDNDKTVVDYIYANSESYEYTAGNAPFVSSITKEEMFGIVRNALINTNSYYVEVIDAETGKPIYGVEPNLGVFDGDVILNLNSCDEDVKVKVLLGGKEVDKFYDLREEEEVSGDVIELIHYRPRTFRIEWDNTFFDTYSHWAEENIMKLTDMEIVNGMSESRFMPDAQITRAQFLALLMRTCGFGEVSYNNNVPDVNKADWYAGNVAKALELGIINPGESFRPNDAVNRAEMCELLIKCYEQMHGKTEGYHTAEFADMTDVSENVSKAVHLKLMQGYEDGRFAPYASATRAEATTVIARFAGI